MSATASKRRPLDFDVRNLKSDLPAALTMALVSVPDAIASAILAGVNPIYGMNAMMVGMPVADLLTSSQFMNVNLTAAMMLITANALAGIGSTYITVLDRYCKGLQAQGGKLLLAEVSVGVLEQLERTGLLDHLGEENVYLETPRVYFATRQAIRAAESWLSTPAA